MKTAILFITLLLASTGAFAQSVGSNSNSGSNSDAGAAAQSGSSLTFNSGDKYQAPGVGVGSIGTSFATDYCNGAIQSGISIPGGSAAFGKSIPDTNCIKLRRFERINQSAMAYMAAGDRTTSAALRQAAINLMCGTDIETFNAMALAGINCQMLPGGKPVDPHRAMLHN